MSLSPLFINWCYNHGIKKLPNHWWTRWFYFGMVKFFLIMEFWQAEWNATFGKDETNSVHGFQSYLKFKVALNPIYRIALNVSLNLSIYYSFKHVLKPGTPEHRNTGTPEHRNIGTSEHRNTGTLEHRNTITLRNTPDNWNSQKSPEHRIWRCCFVFPMQIM